MGRYVIGAINVQIAEQATRPREPSRPSRGLTSASPMMATRQRRPRETIGGLGSFNTVVSDKYLTEVKAARGKQKELEMLLKEMGSQLKECQDAVLKLGIKGDKAGSAAASACALALQKDIAACIDAIKACANQASNAANAAISAGATQAAVKDASKEASYPIFYVAPTQATTPTSSIPYNGADTSPVKNTSAQDTVIETSNIKVTPDGDIVPGVDAVVVQTPALTDPNKTVITPAAPASGGIGIGTAVVVGILGYLIFRKR